MVFLIFNIFFLFTFRFVVFILFFRLPQCWLFCIEKLCEELCCVKLISNLNDIF